MFLIRMRSHRVNPANRLTPNMCCPCFHHFLPFPRNDLLLTFCLFFLVHFTVLHWIDLGPFPMTPPLQTESRKYAKTKTMCICKYTHISVVEQEQDKQNLNLREQGLLWGCLVLAMQQLTCAAPPSNAVSFVNAWGLQNWSCSTDKYTFALWKFSLLSVN